MKRLLGTAAVLAAFALPSPVAAEEGRSIWDLSPKEIRTLVAAPQVMVTRTATGWESYCRCPVVLKPAEIPESVKKAIIAVEDRRFLEHGGVDFRALAAVLRGGLSRGGSTIPMQLLKNLVFHDLQRSDLVSKLERKRAEIWHAGAFDEAVGKQELLAAYLNQIEFGGREIVGLYRASRHYFRKEPKDLNLYESALLAGMVQAPARLNPLKESTRERAHERAKLVLELMAQQGRITRAEQQRALKLGIRPGILPPFKIQPQPFTEWITQVWAPDHVKEGETVRFFVTLDARSQRLAERNLAEMVTQGAIPAEYEAGAVMMTGDGRVRAMIGGIDWSKRQFNTAVKSQVQPGSTAKLALMVAACEAGRKPTSPILDLPVTGDWPSNGAVGYRGQTTLMEAFAQSRNAAAVRLAWEIGVRKVAEVSRELGVDPGANPDSAFVLGTFSTSVMTMTAAYASVANGGFRVAPSGVLAVVDGRGQVRASFMDPIRTRVIPQRCIEPTRAILREVVRSGTGRGASLRSAAVYGKTGTSTGNADAWFIGWSESRVLGVWMGKRRDVPGGALAGGGAPSELFRRIAGGVGGLDGSGSEKPPAQLSRARSIPAAPERVREPVARTGPADEMVPRRQTPAPDRGIARLRAPQEGPAWLRDPWSEIDDWVETW
ncbi:transglycosylase domain-containing protein [Salinarimonas soli]|uniref:transglycosylase domain-containing protein n=1 Tax=Salinarimonas soli TaxID=1638099 RepID=UPI001AEED60B|nr:transglycosylase domain-containing protein [Salinarimonas soli]